MRARLQKFMDQPGQRVLVLPANLAKQYYDPLPPNWKMETVEGIQMARGFQRVRLAVLVKPDQR
jgi:hypothetical protein